MNSLTCRALENTRKLGRFVPQEETAVKKKTTEKNQPTDHKRLGCFDVPGVGRVALAECLP